MSANAAAAVMPEESLARLAAMPATPGVQYPRIAPKTLALVVALHVGLLAVLANYRTEVPEPPKPVMVTLVAPEPAPEPPKPEIVPPKVIPPVPKPVKKKVEPKPEKKPEPVAEEPRLISKAPETSPAPAVEPPAPVTETKPAPQPEAQPEPAPAPPKVAEEAPPIDPPRFNADYLDNPAPVYPAVSRRLGEQGKVLLRVQVTAEGTARVVNLHKTSGYTRLDQIALDTVKRWKFVPARQGDKPVEAWVIVPINFSLRG